MGFVAGDAQSASRRKKGAGVADLVLVHGEVRKVEAKTLTGVDGRPDSNLVNVSVLYEDSIVGVWGWAETFDEGGGLPGSGDVVTLLCRAKPSRSGNSVSYEFREYLDVSPTKLKAGKK